MKKALSLLLVAMLLVGMLPAHALHAHAAETTETLNIYGSTGSLSETTISWTSGAVTFTNAQESSTTAIRTSDTDHYRLYANSSVTVSVDGGTIDSIVVTCTNSSYATALQNSAGSVATASGSVVTITPTASAAEFKIDSMTVQSRINKVVVTYSSACSHTNTTETTTPATCTADGSVKVTCDDCSEVISTTVIPATGHNYVDGVCQNCQASIPVVSFVVPSVITAIEAITVDPATGSITLPTPENYSGKYEYTFAGWVETALTEDTQQVTGLLEAGQTYTPSQSITLNAVYTYTSVGSGTAGYKLIETSALKAGDTVVITTNKSGSSYYAMSNANGTSSAPTATAVTVSGDQLTGTIADTIKWVVGGDASGYIFYPNGDTTTWLYCTSTNNGVRVGTNDNNTFVIDATSGYLKHSGTGRYIGVYNNADWRCYTSTTTNIASQTLGFFAYSDGNVTTYTSTLEAKTCDHSNTTETTTPATCTTAGSIIVTCDDCGETISNTPIEPTGHSYGDWVVTAATCTEDGSQTRSCQNEGCTATETEVLSATGHNYVDGACENCGEAAPEAIATLITSSEQLVSGQYVIVTDGYGAGTYDADSAWILSVQPIIYGNDILDAVGGIWTLTVTDSSVTIKDANDVSVAPAGGNNNGISSGEYSWAWTWNEDGTVKFSGQGDDTVYLAANKNSDYKIRAYKHTTVEGNTTGYLANFSLYKVIEDEEETCAHTNTTTATVDATCTVDGSVTVTCDDCNEVISTEVISATGHNYVDNICSNCGAEFEGEIDEPDATEPETTEPETTEPETTEPESSAASATIDFSTTDQRVSLDTSSQVWSNGGATLTNTSSTSNIVDYSNPVRFYKNTEIVIAFTDLIKLEFTCNSSTYAETLVNSISDGNATVTQSESLVTIELNDAVDSYTITLTSGQVRVDSLTVYAQEAGACEHDWSDWVVTNAPTCTEDGLNTATCSLCSATKTQSVPATGHTLVYGETAITCANCDHSVAYTLSTIAEAKAGNGDGNTYYIKGIVTYVKDKDVYMEDATGGILVYGAAAFQDISLGDELLVWDAITEYSGKVETSNTTTDEYLIVSSGNPLPCTTVTIEALINDTEKAYYGMRVLVENAIMGVMGTNNTPLTDADGNSINIYGMTSGWNELINEADTVNVTAIASAYNTTNQLLVNPGTVATDIVEIQHGEVTVVETVTIQTAKDGTAGEYYQVEGTVTFISGRNVYIQDATGGIVIYLNAAHETLAVGDKVKAYGQQTTYNGLIELTGVDGTNTTFFEILSNGNTVDAQAVSLAGLLADTTNEYLSEKITMEGLYVTYVNYNSYYGNVTYDLEDGSGNVIEVYRAAVTDASQVVSVGSIVNVEAVVSSYNGYQLLTTADKIVSTGKLVDSWGLILGDQIGAKFNLNLSEDDVVSIKIGDGEAMEFTMGIDADMNEDYTYSVIVPVAAAEMTADISITLKGVTLENTYSVRKYADVLLADETQSAYHDLVKQMLNYGAASQTYFDINTDDLANNGITLDTTYTVPTTCDGAVVEGTNESVRFYGASLVHKDRIAVRFYFVADEAFTVEGAQVIAKDGLYYVEIANINPQDMGTDVSVTVGDMTVSYSPLDYMVRMNNKSADGAAIKTLVNALYGYYQAAAALTAA